MNWTIAELRRRLKANPQLALEYPYDAVGAVESGARGRSGMPHSTDQAETLYALLRIHAPDLYPLFVRELAFEKFKIDLAIDGTPPLAIEVNGGYSAPRGGKHGTDRDHQKIRKLTQSGYIVLIFTTNEVRTNPLGIIEEIRKTISIYGII